MSQARKPTRIAEGILSGVLMLESVLALVSGVLLVARPSGALLQMPQEWLIGTPFATYLIPGLLLTVALGVLPLFAAFALWRMNSVPGLRSVERVLGMDTAWLTSVASGAGMLIWIVTQVAMVQMFHPLQAFIFMLGAVVVLLTLLPSVRASHTI